MVVENSHLSPRRGRLSIVAVSSTAFTAPWRCARWRGGSTSAPAEPHPDRRDVYSHAKWRQEKLFRDRAAAAGHRLVIIRPGVVYGPGGSPISARVGLNLFGWFLHLGGGNRIPLTYVDNCADAIVAASEHPQALGQAFNVVDTTFRPRADICAATAAT
jgi:nucleoside-diphosphate-sugar epimerase